MSASAQGARGSAPASARGEVVFQAGDREVRVLFTNRSLADVEQKLGRGIVTLAQEMSQGITGVSDTVQLLRAGMEAARRDAREPGPAVAMNTAFDVMDVAGFGTVLEAVMDAVSTVLSYGTEEEGADPNP